MIAKIYGIDYEALKLNLKNLNSIFMKYIISLLIRTVGHNPLENVH